MKLSENRKEKLLHTRKKETTQNQKDELKANNHTWKDSDRDPTSLGLIYSGMQNIKIQAQEK